MKRAFFILLATFLSIGARCSPDESERISATGEQAMKLTEQIVAFGPRPPGSASLQSVRTWIRKEVAARGFAPEEDKFTARTPIGEIEMTNISYVIAGTKRDREVLLVAHYDSKRYVGFDFVGANDAASSVGLLIALTGPMAAKKYSYDVRVLLVDGEEALVNWTASDSLYGSRHFVDGLRDRKRIRAAVVVDMIGDADLKFIDNEQSALDLRRIQRTVLKEEGLSALIDSAPSPVDDDHTPFFEAGIPILHLMDFTYPPWHTEKDTLDKISTRSLSITGELILKILDRI